MRQIRLVVGLLLSLLALQAAGKDKPDFTKTEFDNILQSVLYFEDSDTILATDPYNRTTYRSEDGGAVWKPVEDVEGSVIEVLKHPYDKKTAVIIGLNKHWITHDRGDSWDTFETDANPSHTRPAIVFHATDPKRMLFQGDDCIGPFCDEIVYYTTDGFKSAPKLLSEDAISCSWAKTTDVFTTGDKELDANRVMCIARGKFDSIFRSSQRIMISDDFFDTEFEPVMSSGQTIEGVSNLAAVKKYIVFAARSERTTEMAMYVSDDTKTWHRAEFGEHKVEEDAYTLLESTNYSMQVDVMTSNPINSMGVLLTSNSNGTFFTRNIEHTNRALDGYVDFEKIANIQGIVLVNTVSNFEEVEDKPFTTSKKLVSQISFDDGRTWNSLKAGDKNLHLHSVTSQRNIGRIFSSPAPGLVMGVGNTGKSLGDYKDGDLYVSDDAGVNWKQRLEKPHLFEFGAQGSILVAIEDAETSVLKYSLDFGKSWDGKVSLEEKVTPISLTTTPDSTSLKFLLTAEADEKYFVYSFDFDGLHERECKNKDFEKWPARVDADGEHSCIMGHKQSFQRRKADANCLVVSADFEDPKETREPCDCTEEDFECDYNFKREGEECVQTGPIIPPEGECKAGKTEFMGSSGYRLIPGNDCKIKDVNLAEEVPRKCSDSTAPPASDDISIEITDDFLGDSFEEFYYLERESSSSGDDETIVMRTSRGRIYKTHDHGKKWVPILPDEEILAIYPHLYNNDRVYLITPDKKVFYSTDRLHSDPPHHFETHDEPAYKSRVLSFHPKNEDWLIWQGQRDCQSGGTNCMTVAQFSSYRGEEWETLLHGVEECLFVYRESRPDSQDLIYCSQFEDENPDKPLLLLSSTDKFEHHEVLKRDVISFATMSEYIVVAISDEEKNLKVDTSIDGSNFADAQFPYNFNPDHQTAYTVLDSSTHAIFLHVTVNDKLDQEYGSIIKSNSNGTHYVLSVRQVNRNRQGYVDFEKMQGVEGVAVINGVANVDEVENGKVKKLQTFITHNDGATWDYIGRPDDPPNDSWGCKRNAPKAECSLHIHGYTERKDPRHTYSSPSAVGIMLATGNVGEFLGPKKDADTFITRDGGLNWQFAAEGSWMWEYGDMGSIIVIVKEGEPTELIQYTLDEGQTWLPVNLGKKITVSDITTVPSDTSRNFLLWGKIDDKIATINIDFSGLEERHEQCKLDETNPGNDDYTLWSPKHPELPDDCLFGHVAEYHRKKPESNCYNGKALQSQISHLHNVARNCSCSRRDFECDYNYEPDGHGNCKLVPGYDKPDPAAVCKQNEGLLEYNDVTGYRRIPLTTCQGGKEMDYTVRKHACPGKEDEFNEKHGLGGAGLFFAIVIPIAAAAGVGYWVYKNWDGKFGQIRLGDGSGGYGGTFDSDAPWVRYPVMALSGLVAVLAAIPMLVGSLWRTVSTRLGRNGGAYQRPFTSRDSFARGRGSYAVADEDEGELLGEESDEDI